VTEGDVRRIADYIKADSAGFVGQYCCISGGRPVLAQNTNGYCVFWNGICTIHPVKPPMCRAWPFIQSVLIDIKNWHAMADSCPGIRTDIPDDIIKKCVKRQFEEASLY
jgi:Fe-S-cluster containining protein